MNGPTTDLDDRASAMLDRCARMQSRLIHRLTAYCGDRDLAEEVTQDVLLTAVRQGQRLAEVEQPWGWLWRVAVNRTSDHYRQRAVAARHNHRLTPVADDPDPAEQLTVLELVAALRPRDRQVLWLRYVEQRTVAETARILGTPEGTVKSLASRALEGLRTQLAA